MVVTPHRQPQPQPLAESPWAGARWLVLAPHPDDETLGAGALIADSAAGGRFAGVVFLTDGSGSQAHVDEASRNRLIAIRREEGSAAVRLLAGDTAPAPVFLDWPDAAPWQDGDALFDRTVDRLVQLCADRSVSALAVTAEHEPHCDHTAAWRVAEAVAVRTGPALTVFEYLVWADTPPPHPGQAVITVEMPVSQREVALAAHASQLTPSQGTGFRLPDHRRVMPAADILYVRDRA